MRIGIILFGSTVMADPNLAKKKVDGHEVFSNMKDKQADVNEQMPGFNCVCDCARSATTGWARVH